jgi:transposase
MSKGRRKFSEEFKREAVALVLEHGYSLEAAGRSVGVRGGLVGRWKREIEEKAGDAFPGKGNRSGDQQRIHELEAENRRLRMEKEILKKAAVFFAKENS